MTRSPEIVCNQPDDVAEVQPLDGFRLRVRFHDGVEGHVDMNELVHSVRAGVFAVLADPDRFAEAYVQYGAVAWPGELDLAPDAMYEGIKNAGEWVLRLLPLPNVVRSGPTEISHDPLLPPQLS